MEFTSFLTAAGCILMAVDLCDMLKLLLSPWAYSMRTYIPPHEQSRNEAEKICLVTWDDAAALML